MRELFAGNPEFGPVTPYPELGLGRAQQIEPLLSRLRSSAPNGDSVEFLRELDLLARPVTWPSLLLTRVVQQVAVVDVSTALSLIAQLALGLRLIRTFANEAAYRDFLRPPTPVVAFALTEASPGSDVSQIQTYAEPVGTGYRISGVKSWVTNATFASHFLVFARTSAPQAGNKPRLSAFLVPRQSGVTVRAASGDVLVGAGVGELVLDRVLVPESALLGQKGKGFRIVMAGLSEARLLLGAATAGACIRSFNDTVARLNERRAFGRPVGNFPSVQDRVAGMVADALGLESLVHSVAGAELRERGDPVEPALVRLAASKTAGRVLDASRDLHGAAAFGGPAGPARRWTDTRALTLLDGSDSALESYLFLEGTRELRRAAGGGDNVDPWSRLDAFGNHALAQVRARVRRALSAEVPGTETQALAAFVHQLGDRVQEALRSQGPEIVERQHLHRRLAAIAAELATWEALSSRVSGEVKRHGAIGARRMTEAARIWVSAAEVRVSAQFAALTKNDDPLRDAVANRVYTDGAYPFDIL